MSPQRNRSAPCAILWLTGWGMPDDIFDRLRARLPAFDHMSASYREAETPEAMLEAAETAARRVVRSRSGPLLAAGWSLGGSLALHLAMNGRVDGVVLFSSTARFVRSPEQADLGWAEGHLRRMTIGLRNDREETERRFRRLLGAEWDSFAAGRPFPSGEPWTTDALEAGLRLLRSTDLVARLPDAACPVLIVHGTEDRICPYPAAEEMVAALPNAALLALTGGGHAPFMGRERQVAQAIRSWWQGERQGTNRPSV